MNPGAVIRIKMFLVILLSCSIGFSQARQVPSKQRPAPPRTAAPFMQQAKFFEETSYVTKLVLKNGMTVLVNENRTQPVISIQAYVRTGFFDEPSQSPGIARLLEGMAYRGVTSKTAGSVRQETQTFGGALTSSTGYQNTFYEVVAPSSQWKKALAVQADALLNPSLDQEELRQEVALIQQEARADLDDPYVFAGEKLLELGFHSRTMGTRGFISNSVLGNITRENLSIFHKAMYVPARITLVISGDILPSEILNEVVRIYDKPSGPGPKPAALPFEAFQNGFRYSRIQRDVPVPQLLFGFHAASERSEDFPALEVLNAVLGLGEGSVLAARLRDQKKLLLAEETRLMAYPDFSYLTIRMEVEPEQIDRCEIAALTEMELLKRHEIDEAGMERALALLERAYWTRLETVTGRAQTLAQFEFLGDWKQMDGYVSRLRRVKPSDVNRVANKYLRLDNCSLVEYLPVSAGERDLTAEGARKTFEGLLSSSADQEQLEREKETVLAVSIPAGASSFKSSEIRYPFQQASILRGPDMFIREDHTTPLVDIGLFFPGGRLGEIKENAGITELMLRVMLRGTQERSAAQFYRQLEVYGGQIQPVVTDDYFGVRFSMLSRNIDAGLSLLSEAIKAPRFDKEEVDRQKKIQSLEILRRRNSENYPRDLIRQALFRDFPYALEADGSEASLAKISPDSLRDWFESLVKNRKPAVVVIGDTKGASLATHFVQHFSGSRFQSVKLPDDFAKPLDKGEQIEQNWSKSQSWILVGFQAPPEDDEDEYPLIVVQNHAGGAGRFFQEIRERRGAAWRVFVSYEPRLRGGSIVAGAAAAPGSEDAVFKDLQEEIQHLVNDPITYREYRSAVNAAVGAYWINYQLRSSQIAAVVRKMLAGKGIEGFQNLPAFLQDVKEDDLKDVARRVFRMEKAVVVRLSGQSSLK